MCEDILSSTSVIISRSKPGKKRMWGTATSHHSGRQRSAGVAPEVNLRERTSHMPPPSLNKAAHSGFETQRTLHQKSKNRGISGPINDMYPNFFFKKKPSFDI